MASSSCILQKSILPGVFVLITFSAFSGCGVLSIFITSLVLIISTILFTYAKRKYQEETVQEVEVLSRSSISHSPLQQQDSPESESEEVGNEPVKEASQQQQDSPEFDEVGNKSTKEVVGISSTEQQQCFPHFNKVSEEEQKVKADESHAFQEKAVQKPGGGAAHQIHPDLYSESESIDDQSFSSDQDSDIDWPYSGNLLGQSPECSDDSISDEESLIEIALPSGHYVGPKEENPKLSWQQKLQDFPTETKIFHQHSIKQLFAEINDMNEEENLIEIDLSMGSIKCSRFEIEA